MRFTFSPFALSEEYSLLYYYKIILVLINNINNYIEEGKIKSNIDCVYKHNFLIKQKSKSIMYTVHASSHVRVTLLN